MNITYKSQVKTPKILEFNKSFQENYFYIYQSIDENWRVVHDTCNRKADWNTIKFLTIWDEPYFAARAGYLATIFTSRPGKAWASDLQVYYSSDDAELQHVTLYSSDV